MNVKRCLVGMVVTGALMGLTSKSYGQDLEVSSAPKMRVGGAAAFVVPTGDWGDATGIGLGVMGNLNYFVTPQLAVGPRLGYVYHLSKDVGGIDFSTSEILILGGASYFVTPEVSVSLDTGINIWGFKASAGGMSDSESETRIPLQLGAGYSLPMGVTFGASLFIPNLLLTNDGEDTQMGLMFNVGYQVPI